jgi:thymidylate synthase ThyX
MNTTILDWDRLDPESLAMLQAFYSRSHTPVTDRLNELGDDVDSVKEALKKYYIGYGHDSIGDCATVTVFIEDVSLPVAKAFQDHALYNGQESSTRYIPFNRTPTTGNDVVDRSVAEWLGIYEKATIFFQQYLLANNSLDLSSRAIAAKAFDITRGLLPNAVRTQLSVTMSFRQFNSHLKDLLAHPFDEVREVAYEVLNGLHVKYPNAIRKPVPTMDEDAFRFFLQHDIVHNGTSESVELKASGQLVSIPIHRTADEVLRSRDVVYSRTPDYVDLEGMPRTPDRIYEMVDNVTFAGTLDYGSYRDIQRHRNGFMRATIPSLLFGMNEWYLEWYEKMPDDLKERLRNQINEWFSIEASGELSEEQMVSITPLSANVILMASYSLPQMVYVLNLRSKATVHDSLRVFINKLHMETQRGLGAFYEHVGMELDRTPINSICQKRGDQTIMKDGEAIE